MAYPPGPVEWVPGQRLDADDLNDWMQNLPWGLVGSASISASSSSFTTVADVSGLSVAFTALADRRYVVSFSGHVISSVGGDRIDVIIADGANTQIKEGIFFISGNNANNVATFSTHVLTPGAGSVTYKIRAERVSGSGTCQIAAAATNQSTIYVHDVGSA